MLVYQRVVPLDFFEHPPGLLSWYQNTHTHAHMYIYIYRYIYIYICCTYIYIQVSYMFLLFICYLAGIYFYMFTQCIYV